MKNVYLLCNAHIDPVWQWDLAEGKSVALSTFAAVADLLDEYDFIFCHNESVLYEWVEEFDPDLFERIKKHVKSGKWKIMGGWYLQPDCNIPTAESIARQAIVGRRFFEERFSISPNTVAINLDAFGHSSGLPLLLNKLGYTGYIGHRPMKEYVELSSDFAWNGLGGGRLLFARPSSYNSLMGEAVQKIEGEMQAFPDDNDLLVLWGVGNHGGGPSRKDLEDILKLQKDRPEVHFIHSCPEDYFARTEAKERIEVYGDLYPCFPGCYTSQIEVKLAHRQLENLMYSTEKLLSYADAQGVMEYPHRQMEKIQKVLLFSQFHDILPGTSVRKVKEESLRSIGAGINDLSALAAKAIYLLTKDCKKAKPLEYSVFVFNPAPYPVKEYVENPILMAERFMSGFADLEVSDENGKVASQVIKEDSNIPIEWAKKVAFEADLEPMSIKRYDVKCVHYDEVRRLSLVSEDIVIENDGRKITVGAKSGLIESLVVDDKELICGPAFVPVLYDDNEDPWAMQVYQQRRLGQRVTPFRLATKEKAAEISGSKNCDLPAVRIIEDGRLFCAIEAVFELDASYAVLEYKVYKTSPKVVINVELVFNHKDKMVKLEVPTNGLNNVEAQIMGGSEALPADGSERIWHKWMMMHGKDGEGALAIINNGVYAFSATDNVAEITLVRSPGYTAHYISPDRKILRDDRYNARNDIGEHRYSFELLGGAYEGVRAIVDRQALSFNEKPFVQNVFPQGTGGLACGNIKLVGDTRVLMTVLKKSTDGNLYARLVNMCGEEVKAAFIAQKQQIDIQFAPFETKTVSINGDTLAVVDEIKI